MTFKQTLKEQWESNPLVYVASLVIGAFLAGLGLHQYLSGSTSDSHPVVCRIEGLGDLENAHSTRVTILQNELVKFEASASDHSLISAYQDKYRESADRVRKDIDVENSNYQSAIQALARNCE